MELTQLQSFLEAVKSGSFRGAARALYVSQPSLSGRIRSLERELRAPLFHRLGRGVRLTEAGEAFRPFVERALDTLDLGREAVRQTQESERSTITIGSARTIGTYILPPTLDRFQRRFPHVSTRIRTGRSSDVIEMVATGVVDVGLSRGIYPPRSVLNTPLRRGDRPRHLSRPSLRPAGDAPKYPRWGSSRSSSMTPAPHISCSSTKPVVRRGSSPKSRPCSTASRRPSAWWPWVSAFPFLPRSAIGSEIEQGSLRLIELVGDHRVHLPTHVLVRRAQHYSPPLLAFLGAPSGDLRMQHLRGPGQPPDLKAFLRWRIRYSLL